MIDGFGRTELPGGLTVLSQRMAGVRSASLGIWVRAGSITESPPEMGISHLLEHMVFKGTRRRSARELAIVLERLGGSLDAYTTREHTSYQARVLDTDIDIALDVLADLVTEPLLRDEDLTLEREVVLEEIATVEDTPDDLVFDLHATQLWGAHPYGYSILGTLETVGGFGAADLQRVHAARYHRGNMVIAGAGNIEHQQFVEQVRRVFDATPVYAPQSDARDTKPDTALSRNGSRPPVAAEPRREAVSRATAQTHIVWGVPTFGHGDPRRYALILLSNAFGGGMSSRLFQRVREEMGLAYTVYSYQSFYADAGVMGVYVGTRPDSADRAESVVADELRALEKQGITQQELDDAKGQVRGQTVISLESPSSRMHRLAGTELYNEPFRTVDEIMALVDAVTIDDVAELAALYFPPDRQTLLRLGPSNRIPYADVLS